MTEQQQNILALFNTKDPVNMEIAEETAISTGNGVWFSNWIDEQINKIITILEKYCYPTFPKDIYFFNIKYLQVILRGIYIEPFYEYTEIRTDVFSIDDYNILIFRKCGGFERFYLQKELEEMGIKVNFVAF